MLEKCIIDTFGEEKKELSKDCFKKLTGAKDDFFVDRMFALIDSNNRGVIDVSELIDTFTTLQDNKDSERIRKKYDINFYFKSVLYTGLSTKTYRCKILQKPPQENPVLERGFLVFFYCICF